MYPAAINSAVFENFAEANRAILTYLHQRLGFALWMVTRVEGNDWIMLQVEDNGYGVEEGTVLSWADSFCSQMVQGLGPRIAPCAEDIPAYVAAPIKQQLPISAYIGVPLIRKNGSLFGTLCAIDKVQHDESLLLELPMLELFAKLITAQLESDLIAIEQTRQQELTEQEAMIDSLTGVLNRGGWDKHLKIEEERARSYGNSACVLYIDLDDLKKINDTAGHEQGDILIRNAAQIIRNAVRKSDIVARMGGDEFAVLAIDCDINASDMLLNKVIQALEYKGINASVGKAMRDHKTGLSSAVNAADKAMYAVKAERRRVKSETPLISWNAIDGCVD
jgi:diguanylate cyclase